MTRCSWNCYMFFFVVFLNKSSCPAGVLYDFCRVNEKQKVLHNDQSLCSTPLLLIFPVWLKLLAFPVADLQDVGSNTEPPNLLSQSLYAICWVFACVAAVCHSVDSKLERVPHQRWKPSRQATISPLLDHMTTTMVAPAVLATLNLCFFILLLETVSAMSATYLWQCWDIIKNLLVGYNSYSTDTSSYRQQDLEIDLIAVD